MPLLGVANLAGVDKLVIAEAGAPYPGFGDWAEQLVAESTGKDGKGILPVVVEGLDAPNFQPSTPDELLCTVGPDFVFDSVRPASGFGVSVDATLGAQMLLWEYATSVAGRLIGINPFDQPDVESAKAAARSMLDGGGSPPTPAFVDGPVTVYASDGLAARRHRHGPRRRRRAPRPPQRRARLRRRPGVPRPSSRRGAGGHPWRPRAAYRPAGDVRLGPALPALDRVSTTRAAPTPGSTSRSPASPRPTSPCPTVRSRSRSS